MDIMYLANFPGHYYPGSASTQLNVCARALKTDDTVHAYLCPHFNVVIFRGDILTGDLWHIVLVRDVIHGF